MLKRIPVWFKNLTPLKQLSVAFITNWIIWFIASLVGDQIFYDEKHSLASHIFYATWMAFFMTIFFNWIKFKSLFKRRCNRNAMEINIEE